MSSSTRFDYDKVALLVVREGCLLLCRKKHTTSLLILPGGCKEPGETSIACLERELREELGDVTVHNLEYAGTYIDSAAGESAKTVRIELYRGELAGSAEPHSEIRELVWFPASGDTSLLAPSIRNQILPDLIKRRLI